MGPLDDPNLLRVLWLHAPGTPQPKPQHITLNGHPKERDFHPLGLAIYPSRAREPSNLFVVNDARARTVIEQFSMSPAAPAEATWIRTISHRYLVSPNALALTSPTSFYASNDHLTTRTLGPCATDG